MNEDDNLSDIGEEGSDDADTSSDEERTVGKKRKKNSDFNNLYSNPFVNPRNGEFQFEIGQTFDDVKTFRAALRDYGVKGGYFFLEDQE